MPLPANVFPVYGRHGQVYYYWQRGRNLPKEQRSALVRIKHEPREPEFWARAKALNGEAPSAPKEGTFKAALAAYTSAGNPTWTKLAGSTRESYAAYLAMMEPAWADVMVTDLSTATVITLRDRMAAEISANTANQAMRALSAFLIWCIPRKWASSNVVRDIEPLEHEADITPPWPEDIWQAIVERGPELLKRMAVLGRATAQRISDLTKFRPVDRKDDGITLTIKKTRAAHFIALSEADRATIDGWGCEKMHFYLSEGAGARMKPQRVRNLLGAWLTADGLAQVSPHGLRAMAVCDARLRGSSHQDIAALFGMSFRMVERYSKHIDTMLAARAARARLDGAGTGVENSAAKSEKRQP